MQDCFKTYLDACASIDSRIATVAFTDENKVYERHGVRRAELEMLIACYPILVGFDCSF